MYITNNFRFAKSANINCLLANGYGGGRSSCFSLALGFENVFSFPNVLLGSMRDSAKASKRGDGLFLISEQPIASRLILRKQLENLACLVLFQLGIRWLVLGLKIEMQYFLLIFWPKVVRFLLCSCSWWWYWLTCSKSKCYICCYFS